eukprot:s3716_g4.t1
MGSRLRPRPPAERPDSTVREGKALGSLPPAPCPLPPAPCPLPRPALPCVSTGREHRVVCWLLAFRRAAGTGREDPQPDTNPSQLCFAVTFGRGLDEREALLDTWENQLRTRQEDLEEREAKVARLEKKSRKAKNDEDDEGDEGEGDYVEGLPTG